MPVSAADRAAFVARHGRNAGVSLARDKDGVYCFTHRCRSKSYTSAGSIPRSTVARIEATG